MFPLMPVFPYLPVQTIESAGAGEAAVRDNQNSKVLEAHTAPNESHKRITPTRQTRMRTRTETTCSPPGNRQKKIEYICHGLFSRCLKPMSDGGLAGLLFLFWVVVLFFRRGFLGLGFSCWDSLVTPREGFSLKGGRRPPGFCSVRNNLSIDCGERTPHIHTAFPAHSAPTGRKSRDQPDAAPLMGGGIFFV